MTGNATEITIANKDKLTLVGPIKIKQATNDIMKIWCIILQLV